MENDAFITNLNTVKTDNLYSLWSNGTFKWEFKQADDDWTKTYAGVAT